MVDESDFTFFATHAVGMILTISDYAKTRPETQFADL